jgi:hypothetical protein
MNGQNIESWGSGLDGGAVLLCWWSGNLACLHVSVAGLNYFINP